MADAIDDASDDDGRRPGGDDAPADPADVDGLGLEELWRLCEPARPVGDPLLGIVCDGVRLVRALGEGGMGRVYEGVRIDAGGSVAVKVLRPGPWSRELVRRFAKESAILGRLDHPGISRILAVGACDVLGTTVPAIVMEYVPDALPIHRYVRAKHLDGAAIADLFARVCDAVAHGHAAGVVHRDLKPGNILVDGNGQPKVIDFGVARYQPDDRPASSLTTPSALVGTLQYMSPEQLAGDGSRADTRSDVHALGAVLHELLGGKPAFDMSGRSIVDGARLVLESHPRRPRGVPRRIAAVVARCLRKDPLERYRDAGELAAALRRAGAHRGGALAEWAAPPAWLSASRGWTRRRGELVRGTVLGLVVGAGAVVAIETMRGWGVIDRFNARTAGGLAVIEDFLRGGERLIAAYGFRSVEQFDADRCLVSATGMRKWIEDWSQPRYSYWGPERDGQAGTLVYRFEFPEPAARIEMRINVWCWDFERQAGYRGSGRGATTIEVSADGDTWVVLRDDIGDGSWGRAFSDVIDLPAAVSGSDEVWLRIRLLAEGVTTAESFDPDEPFTVAQFARSSPGATGDTFFVRAFARPRGVWGGR